MRLLLLMTCGSMLACGSAEEAPDAGPFTTELTCPVPGSLPFVTSERDWQVETNEAKAERQPRLKHQPADVLTTPTGGAAYTDVPGDSPLLEGNLAVRGVMARIENNRGLVADAIPDEFVSVWQYSEADGWSELGQVTSDNFDAPSPGGYTIDTPQATLEGAEVAIRYSVLNADGTCGRHFVLEREAGSQIVLSDIDATLTATDEEIILQLPDEAYDPLEMASSVALTNAWHDKGYQMVYVTARPHVFRSETKRWLREHGYPEGPVITATEFVSGDTAVAYKQAWVTRILTDLGWDIAAAYGNATSDIAAYENGGIDKAITFIIGPNAGASGTVAIEDEDYASHIADYVMQQPDAN